MKGEALPPDAPVLLESMRAIGYDTSTAIADLIDNSIAAGATRVSIRFEPGTPSAVAILDDGHGMTRDELRLAMKHGSRSPHEAREPHDLGRFGLGLKTASLSQCRRLTVATKRPGELHAMVWDLDAITSDWIVGVLEPHEIATLPYFADLDTCASGTLVLWEKLDRLVPNDGTGEATLREQMRLATEHLSLVFHRYLSDHSRPLSLDVNLRQIQPLDPFLEDNGSVAGIEELISAGDHRITVKGFTLPHISKLTSEQIALAGGPVGLRRQQGFYVYRNRRLIVWGTWFRLTRQEELTKLTRVRVDVPNALDHSWSLDIKKSAASPPKQVRERLKALVPRFVEPSERAHQYRGSLLLNKGIAPLWCRLVLRDGGIRYELNPAHPLIEAIRASADDLDVRDIDTLLRAIADGLPIESIYNDRATDAIGHKVPAPSGDELEAHLEDLARRILSQFPKGSPAHDNLLANIEQFEPFGLYPDLVGRLKQRLST